MKVYENIATYFPLIYLIVCDGFMGLYHYFDTSAYILNSLLLFNMVVFYEHPYCVNHLQDHLWKAACLIIFGVLANEILTILYSNYHLTSERVNIILSAVYCLAVLKVAYYDVSKSNPNEKTPTFVSRKLLYLHILFGYIPFRQMHQVNVHVFVFYCVVHFIMLYHSLGKKNSEIQKEFYRMSVNTFFIYLRIQEWFLLFGVIQMYLEYDKIYHKQNQAILAEYAYLEKTYQQTMDTYFTTSSNDEEPPQVCMDKNEIADEKETPEYPFV